MYKLMKLIGFYDILISARCIKTCVINKKNTIKSQALKREGNNIIRTERYNCYEKCFVTLYESIKFDSQN